MLKKILGKAKYESGYVTCLFRRIYKKKMQSFLFTHFMTKRQIGRKDLKQSDPNHRKKITIVPEKMTNFDDLYDNFIFIIFWAKPRK